MNQQTATLPDLTPARWIWYPSERCLQNTFVLFRRTLHLAAKPKQARGWISADSRYLLYANGERVQWGPAPCDPRWLDADPIDLTELLHEGENVIGAQVLFYGQGDGTTPLGKPGFLFHLEIEDQDGSVQRVHSDESWQSHLARSWQPGHYKRWYLRALQEEFDARRYPYGWTERDFTPDADWLPAMPHECPPDKPPVCAPYPEYQLEIQGDINECAIRSRTIPMLRETLIPAKNLREAYSIQWKRSPEEYFESLTPNAYAADSDVSVDGNAPDGWTVRLDGTRGVALTFELEDQVVGWPYFSIDAPEGTQIELMVQEAHEPGSSPLLNTHFHSWARFICREGENRFETFDFESCRWIQLHIHGPKGDVTVRDVGMRRRTFPWPNASQIRCSEPALQRLMDASVNTLHNSAQETCVDGMGRERQQYSGDVGHQLHAIIHTFGEARLPARFVATFSQGMTVDGFFLDTWPAYDRLARLMERQMHLTKWGPLLDHGVGHNFDCYYTYLYTGDLQILQEPYPRLLRFFAYLRSIQSGDGLLPVEGMGLPWVWLDHDAFQEQRHKQCAFNLYVAAMCGHALAPLCAAFGDAEKEREVREFGQELHQATVKKFWSRERGLFIINLPWLDEEPGERLCDRSLATAVLFDQCPDHQIKASLDALSECPPHMGFSYPANAVWRLWALAQGGRANVVVHELRTRWAKLESVILNNTLQENWTEVSDSHSVWSHCPVAPLLVMYMSIAGIRPLAPGMTRCEIRPQLADLGDVAFTSHTARGPLTFAARGGLGDRELRITMPPNCLGELVVREEESIDLESLPGPAPEGHRRFRLPSAQATAVRLKHS